MDLILIILILLLLFGGGFGYRRYGHRGGIGIGGILLLLQDRVSAIAGAAQYAGLSWLMTPASILHLALPMLVTPVVLLPHVALLVVVVVPLPTPFDAVRVRSVV